MLVFFGVRLEGEDRDEEAGVGVGKGVVRDVIGHTLGLGVAYGGPHTEP